MINPVTKSNNNEHKRSIFHKRNIATEASIIITMYSNNDLDTTTSTTADKEVESGATTEVIAERVTPGVESKLVNWFIIFQSGVKWSTTVKSMRLKVDLFVEIK